MYFSEKEKQIMKPLFEMIEEDFIKNYEMVLHDGTILHVSLDTCYETYNGLEECEDNYEEFNAVLLSIRDVISVNDKQAEQYGKNKLLEITHHNYPKSIKPMEFEE